MVKLVDVASAIKEASNGKVAVVNGSIYFDGREIINPLTDRILRFVKEGLPFEPMIEFLKNLLANPSRTAIQELYLFLDNNSLPITADGCFLAYRKVDNEYMSFHNNPDGTKNRNMVGDVCEMVRNEVDDIRDNVCSNGLHFCSLSYIPSYYGGEGRVMIVKINPADVVSIPSDYNNAKGRTCKYEVIAEHTDPNKEYKDMYDAAVVSADGSEYVPDGDNDEDEICDDCGEYKDECTCDEDDKPENEDDKPENEDDKPADEDDGPDEDDKPADEDDGPDEDDKPEYEDDRPEYCDDCGDRCGHRPSSVNFHNVRDGKGRFTRK